MDGTVYLLFFAAICIGIVIKMIWDNKTYVTRHMGFIRQAWGKPPQREYSFEEFTSIEKYFRKREGEQFSIDDITWNDLDMDKMFMLANHTQSSIGDEYLYYLLRTPAFDGKTLEERKRLIHFFAENEETRQKLQIILRKAGRTKRISINEVIYTLHDLKWPSAVPSILMALSILLCALIIPFNMPVGCTFLVIAYIHNAFQYYGKKGKIEPYILFFRYIVLMLKSAKEMEKLDIPELQSYLDIIKEKRDKFRKFEKDSKYLTTKSETGFDPVEMIMNFLRLLFHVDIIKFASMLEELKGKIGDIEILVENMGTLDAMISVASFREMLPYYCEPEFSDQEESFLKAENIYHPMVKDAIANHIRVERGVLLTGSNASGKSTFLKTVAINAVLGQSICTCLADSYASNFFKIYSSMALQDDLDSKESYYIVEIKSLKRILDEVKEGEHILCFVDEVLRGTNTIERISASAQILKSLSGKGMMSFAATHDIELTYLLEDYYDNYHFQEEIKDGEILFDYHLYEGRAVSRNAIRLLSIMGYEESIIETADNTAKKFMETGEWSL